MLIRVLFMRSQQTRPLIKSYFVSVLRGFAATAGNRPAEARPELHLAGTVAAVPANGKEAPPPPQPAAPPEQPVRKSRRRHLALDVSIIAGVVVVYVLSLL